MRFLYFFRPWLRTSRISACILKRCICFHLKIHTGVMWIAIFSILFRRQKSQNRTLGLVHSLSDITSRSKWLDFEYCLHTCWNTRIQRPSWFIVVIKCLFRPQVQSTIGVWWTTRQYLLYTLRSFRKGNLLVSVCEDRKNETRPEFSSSSARKSKYAEDSTHRNLMGSDPGKAKPSRYDR
jgi:uncharacterized membrane protein